MVEDEADDYAHVLYRDEQFAVHSEEAEAQEVAEDIKERHMKRFAFEDDVMKGGECLWLVPVRVCCRNKA